MRVLGTTRHKTCIIMVIEQIIFCIFGLAAGALLLMFFKRTALMEISEKLYLYAALYFAVNFISILTCSIIITRHNVLELLQTKE